MLKKYSQIVSILFVGIFSVFVTTASAIDLDEATRTVAQDSTGKTTVLTPEQVKRGKRLFNATCGACHVGGVTKTDQNVGLDPETLSLATPRRDNIDALVNFLKDDNSSSSIILSNEFVHIDFNNSFNPLNVLAVLFPITFLNSSIIK